MNIEHNIKTGRERRWERRREREKGERGNVREEGERKREREQKKGRGIGVENIGTKTDTGILDGITQITQDTLRERERGMKTPHSTKQRERDTRMVVEVVVLGGGRRGFIQVDKLSGRTM